MTFKNHYLEEGKANALACFGFSLTSPWLYLETVKNVPTSLYANGEMFGLVIGVIITKLLTHITFRTHIVSNVKLYAWIEFIVWAVLSCISLVSLNARYVIIVIIFPLISSPVNTAMDVIVNRKLNGDELSSCKVDRALFNEVACLCGAFIAALLSLAELRIPLISCIIIAIISSSVAFYATLKLISASNA